MEAAFECPNVGTSERLERKEDRRGLANPSTALRASGSPTLASPARIGIRPAQAGRTPSRENHRSEDRPLQEGRFSFGGAGKDGTRILLLLPGGRRPLLLFRDSISSTLSPGQSRFENKVTRRHGHEAIRCFGSPIVLCDLDTCNSSSDPHCELLRRSVINPDTGHAH